MAAYAVIARIGRVDPHLALRDLEVDLERDVDDGDGRAGGLDAYAPTLAVDVIRDDEPHRLVEWWSRVRELWTQTTFYVFDANSWRT